MKTAKVLQVKTEATAHVVIRDGNGRKLFEIDVPGVTVVLSVSSDAVIHIEPAPDDMDFVLSTNGHGVYIFTPATERAQRWTDSILPVAGSELMTTTPYVNAIVVGLQREGYFVRGGIQSGGRK